MAYLGVQANRANHGTGFVVDSVVDDTVAKVAGLEPDDVIVVFDGEPVAESLSGLITAREPGDTVSLTVLRDGEEIDLEATLGAKDDYFCSVLLSTSTDGKTWTPEPGRVEWPPDRRRLSDGPGSLDLRST